MIITVPISSCFSVVSGHGRGDMSQVHHLEEQNMTLQTEVEETEVATWKWLETVDEMDGVDGVDDVDNVDDVDDVHDVDDVDDVDDIIIWIPSVFLDSKGSCDSYS